MHVVLGRLLKPMANFVHAVRIFAETSVASFCVMTYISIVVVSVVATCIPMCSTGMGEEST